MPQTPTLPVKPAGLVGRDRQWRTLTRFLTEGGESPLRLGLVSGRRRAGKTHLLRAACEATGGLYHVCVQDEGDRAARSRFAATVAAHAGLGDAGFIPERETGTGTWDQLLRAALAVAARTAPTGTPPLVVLDEFPYALTHAPQLPSLIQHLYDESQHTGAPPGRLVLCGSAMSVMHELLSGTKPLRGRAALDMRLPALDYREAAQLWSAPDPAVAFRLHASVGGIPGYRPLITRAPTTLTEFDEWVVDHLLTVDSGTFTRTEVDYLLREDPRITSRATYYDILSAVAGGARTPAKIGGAVGRSGDAVRYPLDVLASTGYVTRSRDLLRPRRSVVTLTDPVIRFDRLVTAPRMGQLELGRAEAAWRAAAGTFQSGILGPHFEHLAREWTMRFAPDELACAGFDEVGWAQVADRPGRARHEVDVVAVADGRVALLGEAKATAAPRDVADLHRLDTLRDAVTAAGQDATGARLALFSVHGFTPAALRAAAARPDVVLVDLERFYTGGSAPHDGS